MKKCSMVFIRQFSQVGERDRKSYEKRSYWKEILRVNVIHVRPSYVQQLDLFIAQ